MSKQRVCWNCQATAINSCWKNFDELRLKIISRL